MNTSDLKRASKKDLLELLLEQTERIEELEKELDKTKKLLTSKKIDIANSGSLAEAVLKITKMFESADDAIKIYTKNCEDKVEKEFIKEKEKKLKEIDKYCKNKEREINKLLSDTKKEKNTKKK